MHNLLFIFLVACNAHASHKEVLVGGDCDETCDLAFEGMPSKLASSSRIAPATEPGEPLTIDGVCAMQTTSRSPA